MTPLLHSAAKTVLRGTGLQYFPVRAGRGFNRGARWTLYPWTSYWRGTHEPEVTRLLESLGDLSGKVCWDLGAHFGYYAVGFALRTGPSGQVVAVEPFPSSFARLKRHAEMNRLSWLKTIRAAVSDVTGTAGLIADVSEGDTGVHLPYDAGEQSSTTAPVIDVPLVRLDDLVARGEIRPPDLVKLDVEGHGHQALAGALETLRRSRPTMLVALHSERETAGIAALVEPLGYRWEAVTPGTLPPRGGYDYLLRPTDAP